MTSQIDKINLAKKRKDDEYFTQLKDIEAEVKLYKDQFKGKVVYCNCDNPESNFRKYFLRNFHILGLKQLICTYYAEKGRVIGPQVVYYNGTYRHEDVLEGTGDFRSVECIELLKMSDIVVTNPPFSLFLQYITQLVDYGKDFLIIGNMIAVQNQEVFRMFRDNIVRFGIHNRLKFFDKDFTLRSVNTAWYTTLDKPQPKEIIEEEVYRKYDNFDAINCDRVQDIPLDYAGLIGVPMTYLTNHEPSIFDLISVHSDLTIDGKRKFARIIIQCKNPRGKLTGTIPTRKTRKVVY